MKSKILVVALVCLALGACEKESKDKTTIITPPAPSQPTQPPQPVTPANPDQQGMYENDATQVAADEQNAQAAPQANADQDLFNKAQEMKQDSANTLSQTQASDNAAAAELEQAAHAEHAHQ